LKGGTGIIGLMRGLTIVLDMGVAEFNPYHPTVPHVGQ